MRHHPRCFNPRVREGRDLSLYCALLHSASFNPRVREGRDGGFGSGCRDSPSFNPRVREGRDNNTYADSLTSGLFQSTRPRGTRLSAVREEILQICFNPRVREGRDLSDSVIDPLTGVSIHASARDATVSLFHVGYPFVFQSTRPRGTRLVLPQELSNVTGFNPRVREGRDDIDFPAGLGYLFQSTRPRGTRHPRSVHQMLR